jgi:hypothetical protein
MAEQRPRRGGEDGRPRRDQSGSTGGGARSGGGPRAGGGRAGSSGGARPGARSGAAARGGAGRPASGERRPARPGADRAGSDRGQRPERRVGEGADRPRHDDPVIPDEVRPAQLDRGARTELKALTKENAEFVARHLVMAGRLIDEDPALAHRHALAAARRAGRIAVVRETVGITAYATGDFALALRELRTYRRISGSDSQLPLMVDSERGVGRPERALELGRSVPREQLDPAVQVALAIAMSGARLDLGQQEAALEELRIPQLDPERAYSWSPDLFDAYATVLDDLGREAEAEEWWQRSDRATIALERAAIPDGEEVVEVIEEEQPDAAADAED